MNQPIVQLRWIFRPMSTARVDAEIQQCGQAIRIVDAESQLTLDRCVLVVRRDFVKDERHIRTRDRHFNDHGSWRVVKERQTGSRLDHTSALELYDMSRRS